MTGDLERRLACLEDESAVRQTIALFSDAVGRNDHEAFRAVWAPDGVWDIREPFPRTARGVDAIAAMLADLMHGWEFFVQLTHSSAVEISADGRSAIARSEIREFARQEDQSRSYDNFAIYDDAFLRHECEWRFARRTYHYIWIDDTPITGRGYRLPPDLGRTAAAERIVASERE